ncbi:MAG: MoaD/ThiS family protein [Chloroflexota bacterium]
MSTVRVPPVLRKQTNGAREVEADGGTVGDVLRDLAVKFPGLENQLLQDGTLPPYVNVYLNDQDIQYLQKLETPVTERDTVVILPAMAGG